MARHEQRPENPHQGSRLHEDEGENGSAPGYHAPARMSQRNPAHHAQGQGADGACRQGMQHRRQRDKTPCGNPDKRQPAMAVGTAGCS